jgi:NADH:ubiquinone oxidoreductase subunit 5 (subunit L)/multisubunit Na+/H+ antiporter MnhA subunit
MAIAPLRWIHTWLYRRMYFDELYMSVLVALTLLFAYASAAFDKYIVDGIVNLAAGAVRQLSVLAGLNDKYVVDGAVDGVADMTQAVGSAVRSPMTGRIRLYVTSLLAAVALGIAAAVVIVLSRR